METGKQISTSESKVVVDLRIPGRWSSPGDFIKRLPKGCRVTPRMLILPDGAQVGVGFAPPDDQFPKIFRSSCRRPPTAKEIATANGYTANVTLSGSGGSMQAARTIMKTAAAVVQAGGAGVFIDNSALAHGGELWLEMTEDGGPDALSFAFVAIVKSDTGFWTLGMHVLGLRDIVVNREEVEEYFDVIEIIRSMAQGEQTAGDIIGDGLGNWYSCSTEAGDPRKLCAAMRNPFGRMRLVKLQQCADKNQRQC